MGEKAVGFISKFGCQTAVTTGEPISTAFLFQRLSVAIQPGNDTSITGTSPQSAKLDNIFYL